MISIPKGTKDLLPADAYRNHYVLNKARALAMLFGFREIKTPIFEHTELFLRGVGDTTDIVNKEMYTFLDKGNRSITLKPEGTASVVRSLIENNLTEQLPQKVYYISPIFRYERPQSGRLREHNQFGIELFGSNSPYADAEVILLAKNLFAQLGLAVSLNINSIGCPECRKVYNQKLQEYLAQKIDSMCETCKTRLHKNPLRILDCKEEGCAKINADAPVVLDYLCEDCQSHHDQLCGILDSLTIEYTINPRIVRGLDYYTRTVFEFVSQSIGAQGTVCGGGRYNNLVRSLGGKDTPAVGFGMGIERLLMVAESAGVFLGEKEIPEVYVAPLDDASRGCAYALATAFRTAGVSAETDLVGRSVKAQMKYANKIGYKYVIVVGENERTTGVYELKMMSDGSVSSGSADELIARIVAK